MRRACLILSCHLSPRLIKAVSRPQFSEALRKSPFLKGQEPNPPICTSRATCSSPETAYPKAVQPQRTVRTPGPGSRRPGRGEQACSPLVIDRRSVGLHCQLYRCAVHTVPLDQTNCGSVKLQPGRHRLPALKGDRDSARRLAAGIALKITRIRGKAADFPGE